MFDDFDTQIQCEEFYREYSHWNHTSSLAFWEDHFDEEYSDEEYPPN